MELLDREIKYLLNKVKIWRPKQENAANQTTDKTEENEESMPDTENDKFAEEQTESDNEEMEEQEMLKMMDATQDPLVLSESEEPRLSDEQVPKKEEL